MGYIYISYSRQNGETARKLASALKGRGYTVWIDTQDLSVGEIWIEQIDRAIRDAEIILALLSPNAVSSRMNGHEIDLAERLQKPIIPVLVEHTTIPASLARRQYLDATGNWEPFVEKLVYAVEANTEVARKRKIAPTRQPIQPASIPSPQARAVRSRISIRLFLFLILGIAFVVVILLSSKAGSPSPTPIPIIAGQQPTSFPTPTPITLVQLVVAAQNLPSGILIPPEAVVLRFWPEALAPVNAVSDIEDVVGQYTRAEILREQPILINMIGDQNEFLNDLTAAPTRLAEDATRAAQFNGTAQAMAIPSATPQPSRTVQPQASLISNLTETGALQSVKETATARAMIFSLTQQANAVPSPTALPAVGGGKIDGTLVAQAVQSTLVVYRATEQSVLSPAEAAQIAGLNGSNTLLNIAAATMAALALGGTVTLVVMMRSGGARFSPRSAHPSAHPILAGQIPAALSEKLLEEYQVFISSSEKDREWVNILVEDLLALGYLVWWYVKDAPGLPFGNEIRSAIFHTKVFIIILSPDSMKSKHIEEEIRWAEIYDRPIIPVVCRPVSVEERLYGLAKGADINFSDETEYKNSLELLTQAIDHYLKKRLEAVQGDESDKK